MARPLALLVAVVMLGGTAHAQVFKPRGAKPAAKTDSKPATKVTTSADKSDSEKPNPDKPKKTTATSKKSSRSAATRRTKSTKKISRAAKDSRPDDLTPDPAAKDGSDPDYVLITDDDD